MDPVWFAESDLRALAGPRSFARGARYVGAVESVDESPDGVIAMVHGTGTYVVRLRRGRNGLEGRCTCPHGSNGFFCKHCVAVGLVVLARDGAEDDGRTEVDVHGYLCSLDAATLVELLYRQAWEDPALYRRLALRAAGAAGRFDPATLRRQIDVGLRYRGGADHQDGSYADRAHDVLEVLEELVDGDHVAQAAPLVRRSAERITEALREAPDPTGAVREAAERAMTLYAKACARHVPDPHELADWLLDQALRAPERLSVRVAEFAGALGADGVTSLREQVEELWTELPSDGGGLAGGDGTRRAVLQRLLEQLAELDGDVDTLVAVHAEALPAVDAYLNIVTLLRDAGRLDEAIEWARRGVEHHRVRVAAPLIEFLVDAYLEAGHVRNALALRWRAFEQAPHQDTYRDLRELAESLGVWEGLRERALEVLHRTPGGGFRGADQLVHVLLSEEDPDGAWAAAEQHGCTSATWLSLAQRTRTTHPVKAVPVYQRLIEENVGRAGREAYRTAADLLGQLGEAYQYTDDPEGFVSYVADLRVRHRHRQAFLDELDAAGIPGAQGEPPARSVSGMAVGWPR